MPKRKEIGIRRLKNEASRIVNEVRERRSEYLVTRRGEPMAVLRPVEGGDAREERLERVQEALARLRRTAHEVGAAASKESAAAAVSRQRR